MYFIHGEKIFPRPHITTVVYTLKEVGRLQLKMLLFITYLILIQLVKGICNFSAELLESF